MSSGVVQGECHLGGALRLLQRLTLDGDPVGALDERDGALRVTQFSDRLHDLGLLAVAVRHGAERDRDV